MRIIVLSTENQWEINRIRQEAAKRGHPVKTIHPAKLKPSQLKGSDALLIRAVRGHAAKAAAIARKALEKGLVVVDERLAKSGGRDKAANYLVLEKAGVRVPPTFVASEKEANRLFKLSFKELVIKPLHGKRGEGVVKCKRSGLRKALSRFYGKYDEAIVQPFLHVSNEYRVLVVGGKALGAFEKKARGWRHNVSTGAKPKKTRLTRRMRELAVKAASAVGTEVGGVDIARAGGRFYVLEVNRSPQFKGFESSTNKNVALEIVEYLERKAEANA